MDFFNYYCFVILMANTNRTRGHNYERKIVKELQEIYKDTDICTSRSESKKLDDAKIDIADPNNSMDYYIQLKSTQNVPPIKVIYETVGKKDKPLLIFWKMVEKRDKKQVSLGESVIMPKDFFYKLLRERNDKNGT